MDSSKKNRFEILSAFGAESSEDFLTLIFRELSISTNAVKGYCKHQYLNDLAQQNEKTTQNTGLCLKCNKPIRQKKCGRPKMTIGGKIVRVEYKKMAQSIGDSALAEILRGSGRRLDPELSEKFIQFMQER